MKSKTIKVEGMTCGHCTLAVEKALKEIGIIAKADHESNTVELNYVDVKIDLAQITGIIVEEGYKVVLS